MSVKRYVAEDMRQALKQIREELGPDAIILSNKRVDGGVEILTTLDAELVQQPMPQAPVEEMPTYTAQGRMQTLDEDPVVDLRSVSPQPAEKQERPPLGSNTAHSEVDATFEHMMRQYRQPVAEKKEDELLAAMRSEIENLRLLLKGQMEQASDERWGMKNPLQAAVAERFEAQGVNRQMARQFASEADLFNTIEDAWQDALQGLARAIPVLDSQRLERQGVIALLGATGVGKTTTIAKLAIRYALKHGRDQLALVTTDSYRLAAYEQLRTLGRILDVPVRLIDENNSLDDVLQSLRHKSMVLIDTAGFHPGDAERVKQLQVLENSSAPIEKLLVLPSTCQSRVLHGVYELMEHIRLDGCVLSKVDEASSLGEVLSLVVEKQLPVAYITDGQKIPDDIRRARAEELVKRLGGEASRLDEKGSSTARLQENSRRLVTVMPVRKRAPLRKRKVPAPVFGAQHA
jgi:flagellar biosynthesis protein FlhF